MNTAALDAYITGNWGEDSIDDETEDTMTTLTELTLIKPYRAPQYLVEIDTDCDGDECAAVTDAGYDVLDVDINGWGSHNAIIVVRDTEQDGDGTYDASRYYLATIRENV